MTWGFEGYGGDSSSVQSQLSDVTEIYSAALAFAAVKGDGTVVTWGSSNFGGDSSSVEPVDDVTAIYSNDRAFAAIKGDGSVVTWGNSDYGGDSSSVQSQLAGVTSIATTFMPLLPLRVMAALLGIIDFGGDSSSVQSQLSDVTSIIRLQLLAAVGGDGTVVTWGFEGWR